MLRRRRSNRKAAYLDGWNLVTRGERRPVVLHGPISEEAKAREIRQSWRSDQAQQTIRNRIDEFGVAEPVIHEEGLGSSRIVVQLPGVDDPERVKDLIKSTAFLEFRLVAEGSRPARQPSQAVIDQLRRRRAGSESSRSWSQTLRDDEQERIIGEAILDSRDPPGGLRSRSTRRAHQTSGRVQRADQVGVLPDPRRRPQVRRGHRGQHRPRPGDRSRWEGPSRRRPSRTHHRPGVIERQLHHPGGPGSGDDAALRCPAGRV